MLIVNIGESIISKRAKKYIEKEIEKWKKTSRTFFKNVKMLNRIIIEDTNEDGNLWGNYDDTKKEIRIYAKTCQYLHIIKYVFFHEFGHHIRSVSRKFMRGYSSELKNLPYCKEEMEAEIYADYYLNLFSLHNERLKRIIQKQIEIYRKNMPFLKKQRKMEMINFLLSPKPVD